MSGAPRFDMLQKAGLAVWAFATVLLFFIALLFAYQLIDLGATPLGLDEGVLDDTENPAGAVRGFSEDAEEERSATLYFAGADGESLVAETRMLPLTPYTQENCRRALEALVEGPRQNGRYPLLPPRVEVRGVYLIEGGELAVDFSAELRYEATRPKSHAAETLMTYGIVNTLTHAALHGEDGLRPSRVRFLFTGLPMDDSFPEHIDLTAPITPDPAWVSAGAASFADDG